MAIVRVDLPEPNNNEPVGWGWVAMNGDYEELTVSNGKPVETLWFHVDDTKKIVIHKDELDHWIKALKSAKKYFKENV